MQIIDAKPPMASSHWTSNLYLLLLLPFFCLFSHFGKAQNGNFSPSISFKRDTFCTDTTQCSASVSLPFTAKSDCSDSLELEQSQVMLALFQTSNGPFIPSNNTTYLFSFEDDKKGKMVVRLRNVPEGLHDLIVVVRDNCGYLSAPTRIPFLVRDCKVPVPVCVPGLSFELLSDGKGGGIMEIKAKDFIASEIYDCHGQGPETRNGQKRITKYSINRVGQPIVQDQQSLKITCADRGKVLQLLIHAWDEKGDHSSCLTFAEVQDNRRVCPFDTDWGYGISGLITTDEAEPVERVEVAMSGAMKVEPK
jgi:large repetitive protein